MSIMADQRRRRRNSGESEFSDDNENLTGKQSNSQKTVADKPVNSSDENEESESDSLESGSESDGDDVLIEYDDEVESALNGERQRGDGEEQPDNLDDDEDRQNPAFIPRQGAFYEHDTRSSGGSVDKPTAPQAELRREKKKLWEDKDRWGHDHYTDEQQAPKSREQIIIEYGYDIRAYDTAPHAPKMNSQPRPGGGRDRRNKFGDFLDTGAGGDGPHNNSKGAIRRPRVGAGDRVRRGQRGQRGSYTRQQQQYDRPSYGDQLVNQQSDRPIERHADLGHRLDGEVRRSRGGGGIGSRMTMPPQPPRQWTNSAAAVTTHEGGQGDGKWQKPSSSQLDWATEVEWADEHDMKHGRHKKVGRTRMQDEYPQLDVAERTDVTVDSEAVVKAHLPRHHKYGPERSNRRSKRPPAPGQLESIVPPTTSVVTSVPASSADTTAKLSDDWQPPANRPKRYSSQRQRPLAESAYTDMSEIPSNHHAGPPSGKIEPPKSMVGPPSGKKMGPPSPRVGPPSSKAGPPKSMVGSPSGKMGNKMAPPMGQAPISSYYRPVYASQPPPIYHSRPDTHHSYPAGHVAPPIVQPQIAFPLPGSSAVAPRMYPPSGPPPPPQVPSTMAPPPPRGPPMSTLITTPVLNYVPVSGQPPPFALQGHMPVPYPPTQVGPTSQSHQPPPPPPPEGIQMRGGTVYFNPQVQQPTVSRAAVRRIKVAIPIVNPQDGQQQNYEDMLPDGTTVQSVGAGAQSYYQIVSVPSDSYYVESQTSDMMVYETEEEPHRSRRRDVRYEKVAGERLHQERHGEAEDVTQDIREGLEELDIRHGEMPSEDVDDHEDDDVHIEEEEIEEEIETVADEEEESVIVKSEDLPQSTDVKSEDLSQSADVNSDDLPQSTDVKSGDLPQSADVNSDDLPQSTDVKFGDLPQSADVNSDDLPQSTDVKSEDLPQSPDVKSEDLPQSTDVKSEDLPQSTDVKSEDLPQSTDVKSEDLPQSIDVKSEDLPQSTDVDCEDLPQITDEQSEDFLQSAEGETSEDLPQSADVKSEDLSQSTDVKAENFPQSTDDVRSADTVDSQTATVHEDLASDDVVNDNSDNT